MTKIDEKAWDELVRCMPEIKDLVYLVRGAIFIYENAKDQSLNESLEEK